MCFLIVSTTLPATFLNVRIIGLHVEWSLFLSDVYETLIFQPDFLKTIKYI